MKRSRSLLLSCILAFALVQSASAANDPKIVVRAGILDPDTSSESSTASQTSQTSTTTTSSSSSTTTSTTSSTSQTSHSTTSTTSTSATSTTLTNTSSTSQPTSQPSQPTQTSQSVSVVTSTGSDGGTVVVTETSTPTDSSSSASSSATSGADSSNNNNDSSGLGTGSIIGLSVAGGVAVLGIIAFFIWKLTRKRFSDFDDNEAIKWPELNAHGSDGVDSHPLPVHNTGRAGFDTGSEVSLSRAPSTTTHTNYSTPDFGNDPYAVPPLPHLNPSQPGPYRDDPSAAGGYYDPYRGPVPGAFSEPSTATEWGPQAGHPGEAYPMTQMASTGRASPGPTMMGRMSPGPGAAYDMRGPSPGAMAMSGRASPGPQAAYDNYGAR
ncbi:hypothetical protein GYMLUDRAFT_76731 [Collybiopsis luxurians FD-317 M1]|uniref:Mid2 domain-containing protein n=1 Tax=Collybiopsis luxurians FD-317 M1 TaxID=944289 RepID=A0A0D0CJI6_9AGAR|nr:hypothetical protein GYMLUDRAFT_76731 [Collybiopsis luxurians FD-317 M1]